MSFSNDERKAQQAPEEGGNPEAPDKAVAAGEQSEPKRPQRQILIDPNSELTSSKAGAIAFKLALPAVAENFLMSLVGMMDMMMVGKLGSAAIAAVGATNQPIFFATAIFQALNVGTTALVARLFGAQDRERANEASRQTLVLTTILSVILGVGLYFFAEPILIGMNSEPDTLAYGVPYFQIVAISLVFNMVMMSVNAQVRGAGDTRTPMINNTATNLINLVLNYVLINGAFGFPRLEVTGAAVATAISRAIGMIMALWVVMDGKNEITISFKEKFRFNWDLAKRVAIIGFPSAIEQFVMRGGNLIFSLTVTQLGTQTYAAHQVAMNILGLAMAPGMGFGMAATTLVGQSLGAKRPDWADACGWATQKMSMTMALPLMLVFFFFGEAIAGFYADEEPVIRMASDVLKIVAFTQIPQASQFVLGGALRGAGDTVWPLISTTVGIWGFRVVLALILVNYFQMGLMGAWIALAVDQLARSGIILYRYMSGKWKNIVV